MGNLWVGESGHENEKFMLYGEPNRSSSFTCNTAFLNARSLTSTDGDRHGSLYDNLLNISGTIFMILSHKEFEKIEMYSNGDFLAVSKIHGRWEGFETLEKWVAGSYAGHSAFFLKDEMGNLWVGESGHENEKFMLYGEPNRSSSFT
ncbi:inositol-1,4,5-trisphosphate 5-phosphatase [Trifolium repens]|nr:inositol-1,4,5-trisphosphate 5-phosphatase [Trifolium repens]